MLDTTCSRSGNLLRVKDTHTGEENNVAEYVINTV
jgi:hypothetical protein